PVALIGRRCARRSDRVGLGLDLKLVELHRGFGSIRGSELRSRVREMARDRVLAEAQLFGDLAIRAAHPRELEHLDLALGQAGPAFAVRDYARSTAELVVSTAEPSEDIGGARRAECAER